MFKITASAAILALAMTGSAFAQTELEAGTSTNSEARSCTTALANLNDRVGNSENTIGGMLDKRIGDLGDTVRGALNDAESAMGSLTERFGGGTSGSAETPVGSDDADASAEASEVGSADLSTVKGLIDEAQAALDSGDEERCLDLAAEAEQMLDVGVQ